tara:strand:+ start:621 stop:794 length:174 start_codon:yes stop_codon:yes gene_type:complete
MPIRKTIQEVADVAVVNGTVLSITTFSNLEIALKLLLLIISIAYTVDKWWFNRKKRK